MNVRSAASKKTRLTFGLTTGLFVALAATGCSASSSADDDAAASYSTDFDSELVTAGTLTVATTATAPPLTTTNDSGDVVGFWPDAVTEIADRLNLKVDIQQIAWDGLLAGVTSHKFDLGDGGILQTDERKASDAFILSTPILEAGVTIVVPEGSDVSSWDDLDGLVVGGTTGEQEYDSAKTYLTDEGVTPTSFETFGGHTEGILALTSGRIDAFVMESSAAAYLAEEQDGLEAIFPAIDVQEQGTVISPDETTLAAAIDEQIDAMIEDGTMGELAEEWYGSAEVVAGE
ncbi:MAG: hypothetical protein JWQ43_214 [Glaciihabitans sp.]|nr:hypothetical protein [Glaciihabitans sp.]